MKRIHCWKRIWIAILVWSILVWIPNTHVFAHSMPQTDLLQTRLAMTQSELSFLQSRLERVKDTTGKILQALHTVRNTSDKLNRLNQQMTAINTILLGLQAVPYAGPILGRIRTVLLKVKKQVHTAAGKIKTFNNKITPTRRTLDKRQKDLEQLIQIIAKMHQYAEDNARYIQQIKVCTSSIRDTHIRQTTQSQVERLCQIENPSIHKLNTALRSIRRPIQDIERTLSSLESTCTAFRPLLSGLSPLSNTLNQLNVVFSQLSAVLGKRIRVPYKFVVRMPFRVRVRVRVRSWRRWRMRWRWKTRWKNVMKVRYYTFSVHQILNGVNSGVDLVNRQMMTLAKKALHPILNQLDIQIPTVPGLARLIDKLDTVLPSLTSLPSDIEALHTALEKIQKTQKTLEHVYTQGKHIYNTACKP